MKKLAEISVWMDTNYIVAECMVCGKILNVQSYLLWKHMRDAINRFENKHQILHAIDKNQIKKGISNGR